MTLDVRSATILLECVRKGSLGRAATALNLTQPAVSRSLKILEEGFGVPLFERNTRGVALTPYGEALLPYAELVVSELASARDVIQQMRGASRGVVRVGGVASVVGGIVMAAICDMRQNHPDISFQVTEGLEDSVLEALKSGDLDIAVSSEPYVGDAISLAAPDILFDTVYVYAGAHHPLTQQRSVTIADIATRDWALPPIGSPVGKEWLKRFHNHALEPKMPLIVSRSVQVIKTAVQSADILCWLPLPTVQAEVRREEMVRIPVAELEWRRTFRVYRRRKGLLTPSAAALLHYIRSVGKRASKGT
ncbi:MULTISPECIES: LysR family transcriptional regulator [unclassified Beijerinckia]|uniref:LysR family transcriptional regulator n=1 Tax=unclassified Beijerinckia TaxID=2638183 RepID=UPI000898788E|nr:MULTISPECIES: LysR family transcriptional regulator [unclassified Beijerinckia]MDH7798249.1 DNA-binding transcriptional LysR family regulator [Beijerinckia sp. GAS462]SED14384.1 transcriptional regulator, LysR family [Beijerinckia sp. 28-YEA-48]